MSPASIAATHAPSFDRAHAERFLLDALNRAAGERAVAVVRFPAPRAPLEAMAALRKGTTMSWRAPEGGGVVAHGAAVTIVLEGAERFSSFESARRALFSRTQRVTHADVNDAAPRLFGGWAFAPASAADEPWTGFGDGRFFLPRWSYERGPGGSSLTFAIDLADGWAGREGLVRAELETVWSALSRTPAEYPPPRIEAVIHADRSAYDASIRAITSAIARGEVGKVVAARRAMVRAAHDLDPWTVLRTLSHRYPNTWRFGLRFGSGTLLAATPERLFVKRGRVVEADALAGSIGAGEEDAEARLRASAKDRREHRPVVEHVRERLAPLCDELEPPREPVVRRLPNVLHLHATVRGMLRRGIDAATLAETLHPTPAVGGVPVEAARRWIAEHETHPRGWYCGPVGWIDADGDAEITVALRCGVVRGSSAWLWAGGGIVPGSEPDAEWAESALKLRPLLRAIGAED